ncbi:hypothetical protein C0989_000305, partial [Termitomyces sp. Mn162]
ATPTPPQPRRSGRTDSSTSTNATCKGTSRRIRKAPWASTRTYGTSSAPWSKKSTLARTPAPSKIPWIPPAPSTCNARNPSGHETKPHLPFPASRKNSTWPPAS